ncbi:MAG: ComEC/Rec2 family competence protein [Bacteroidales bacterium]
MLGIFSVFLTLNCFTSKSIDNTWFGILLFCVLCLSGFLLSILEKSGFSRLEQTETEFLSVVLDYPEEKNNSFMIKTKLKGILKNEAIRSIKGSMVIYHEKDFRMKRLMPGDLLVFRCIPLEIKNKGNPCEFDYRFYMESRGFRYYAFIRHDDIIFAGKLVSRSLRQMALVFRERIINLYRERGVKGGRLALAAAITLGEKEFLDENQKENFSKAGVMHVMAVSGLHAGILSYFIFNILFFLRGKLNFLRTLITLAALWLFAFTAGLTPSILRASLMFSFLHVGQLMKRKVNPVNSMLASAFILTMLRPSVIFDSAFLLSYFAVLFIVLFYRDLYNAINFRWHIPDKIWQMISVSVTAQAGTLPLTVMMFNRFPLLFILSNLVIIPISAIVVVSGFLTVVTSYSIFISSFFTTIMDKTAGLAGYLTEKTSTIPFSSVENIGILVPECLLFIVFLAITLHFLFAKSSINRVYPLTFFLVLIAATTTKKISSGFKNELIVYNSPGQTALGIKIGNTLNLFYSGNEIPKEAVRHGAMMGLRFKSTEISNVMPFMVKAGNKSILITDDYNSDYFRLMPDILILTGEKMRIRMNEINFEAVIFTSTYSNRSIGEEVKEITGTRFWFVKESGCWRQRLK